MNTTTTRHSAADRHAGSTSTSTRRSIVAVVAVVIALVGTVWAISLRDAGEADPSAVIEEYELAYNDADIERIMNLFADDSVLLGHPYADDLVGHAAIRDVQIRDLANSGSTGEYRMFGVHVVGDTVTWDHVYVNDRSEQFCAGGNRAIVVDGRITRWEFARDVRRCETDN